MDDDLNLLIRKRATVKSRMTLFKKYIENLEASLNASVDNKTLGEVDIRNEKFAILLNEYEDYQMQIDCIVNEDELAEQLTERETFEKNYFSLLALSKDVASKLRISSHIDSDHLHSPQSSSYSQHSLKLPAIKLPIFDGTNNTWLEFRDTFQSLIHLNENVHNIQKFHYLRAALTGDAAQVIKSLEFSAANYTAAWDVLCERYNNDKVLIRSHVQSLFALELIHKESSIKIRNLIDTVSKHLRTLKSLGEPTDQWDTLLIYIISEKLDPITSREWEQYNHGSKLSLSDLLVFLRNKACLLDTLERSKQDNAHKPNKSIDKLERRVSKSFVSTRGLCPMCDQPHPLGSCSQFIKLSINDRFECVKAKALCINCLRSGHFGKDCTSTHCRKCSSRHHTLLHFEGRPKEEPAQTAAESNSVVLSSYQVSTQNVLLSTAWVQIRGSDSKPHRVRALLDSGSQSSFITKELSDKLLLEGTKIDLTVSGISQVSSSISFKCKANLKSLVSSFNIDISLLVIPEIATKMPNFSFDKTNLRIPSNIRLADPRYNIPDKIDILLGADCYWNLICNSNFSLGTDSPFLQKTRFGWIISGPVSQNPSSEIHCNFSRNADVQDQIENFWRTEEYPLVKPCLSFEENACELDFKKNTLRENGHFVVSIPLKVSTDLLGESLTQAKRRFWSLERKLHSNSKLCEQYTNFMREYVRLGHMTKVPPGAHDETSFYLPHHAVLKESSTTTKLRVVFDGSAKSSTNYSLNDIQMVGPTIQDDLVSILLRFREHTFVLSADIEKMYRQVLIQPEHRSLQKILWREKPEDTLSCYKLNTVTYGTSSASFLAIRCLYQIADDYSARYPTAAGIIKRDFYVDDLLTGGDTIAKVIRLKVEITEILKSASFTLHKWSANHEAILKDPNGQESIQISSDSNKTLGIAWSPQRDTLKYNIAGYTQSQNTSKRGILSSIAQIFDPLGLLAPVIIVPKILLQELWKHRLAWDDSIPHELHKKWSKFRIELMNLNSLSIPRHVVAATSVHTTMHGFSDASQYAYGACLYVRSIAEDGKIHVNLLCAKSKVAPLKSLTIPRLELCAALLLARLTNTVLQSINLHVEKCFLWCDSTIVLHWIRTPPNSLKVFVSNRIAEIQELTGAHEWAHVSTLDNPADLVSRGVTPSALADMQNWWHGPSWLSKNSNDWPPSILPAVLDIPEISDRKTTFLITKASYFPIANYSNFSKLRRLIAYCIRFKNNCLSSKSNRNHGPLTCNELLASFKMLVKMAQHDSFSEDIDKIASNKSIPSSNNIARLNPFVDEEGILRVGGRLQHSNFDYSKKHPMILSGKHHLTKLILVEEHQKLFHAGPQALLASIRDVVWPTGGRNLAKGVVRQCIRCFRVNPSLLKPKMGNLPGRRVQPSPPFHTTGVDYAGPFLIKDRKGRGSKTTKCYISLFICFTTKAIHLELVSDLTKDGFLSVFRRFVGRRGKPLCIYSDNGTCFTGANNELQRLGDFLKENHASISESIANQGVEWHFIPAYSPHFGGLWEAGVKSTKSHLKRVMGDASLVFEDFYTILVQVESILNSRPLTPISNHPNDYSSLTPAHFLIGRPLTSLPDENLVEIPETRLSRYQRMQKIVQHFWSRWSKEYISEMQQRAKWNAPQENISPNSMVLIKQDNQPPLQWLLGRIEEVHPGKDGIVRVASIRTCRGTIRRAVTRLCLLPIPESPSTISV